MQKPKYIIWTVIIYLIWVLLWWVTGILNEFTLSTKVGTILLGIIFSLLSFTLFFILPLYLSVHLNKKIISKVLLGWVILVTILIIGSGVFAVWAKHCSSLLHKGVADCNKSIFCHGKVEYDQGACYPPFIKLPEYKSAIMDYNDFLNESQRIQERLDNK